VTGTVRGGTIATTGGGTIHIPAMAHATFDHVTVNGLVSVEGSLDVVGPLVGSGTLRFDNTESSYNLSRINAGTIGAGVTTEGGVDLGYDDNPPKPLVTVDDNDGRIRAQRSRLLNRSGRLRIESSNSPGAGFIRNSGIFEVSDGAVLTSLSHVEFRENGALLIAGGGKLEILGDLDLSTPVDFIDVLPKLGGGAYIDYVVASYTGTLSGTFDHWTDGISVSYTTPGEIRITGTPVPEKTCFGRNDDRDLRRLSLPSPPPPSPVMRGRGLRGSVA